MTRRRLLLAVDAEGYGARPQRIQHDLRTGLARVLGEAAASAGLRPETWASQPTGDGELAVLPPEEPEERVVHRFVQELNALLLDRNRLLAAPAALRLRLALHFGPAEPSAFGHSGDGPVVAAGLCDSAPARAVLEQTSAPLAVVLSDAVYGATVLSMRVPIDPGRMRRVRVRVEETDVTAWLWAPGHDVHRLRLEDAPGHGPPGNDEAPGEDRAHAPAGVRNEYFRGATVIGTAIAGDQVNHPREERR